MLITEDKEIDIFVASKIGSFKHIKYHTDSTKNSKKCIENLVEIKSLQKDDSITCMEWGNVEQTEILIGRKNQQVQIYATNEGFTKSYTADYAAGDVVGLGRCKRKLITAVASGIVKIWSKKHEQVIDTGGKLDRMRMCPDDATVFATGGEENDLKIWSVGSPTATFIAKNLPHDWLQLRRPVWVSDVCLARGQGGRVAAVCSRHGYVRLYDTRAQRRPVINVEFPAMAATCMTQGFDDRQVLVGFGRGQLHQVDLRKARPDKGYKGCAGAVTSIALCERDDRMVISCSLDRQVRVHRHDTKELVYKQYLTSKLSCVLVQNVGSTALRNPELKEEVKEEVEEVEEVDDLDQLFDNMETVGEKTKKKIISNATPAKRMKPSIEGSTIDLDDSQEADDSQVADDSQLSDSQGDEAIISLLRSTEKKKRKMEKKKRQKKAKSVFHNA